MPQGKHGASGALIKNAIRNAGVSQNQIAAQMQVSDITVSRWANGWRRPTGDHLTVLASILGVPSTDLVA